MPPTKVVLLLGLAVLSLALSACGGSPTSPTVNVSGTYTLVSARGQSLPAVVSGSPATDFMQEVVGGFVELRPDQTFASRTEWRYTTSGRTTTSTDGPYGGKYGLSGTAITFTFEPGAEQISGTLSNGVLTLRADVELVYRK